MKCRATYRFYLLLAAIVAGSSAVVLAHAQTAPDPQTGTTGQGAAASPSTSVQPARKTLKPNPSAILPTYEEERFRHLFGELRNWEELAKRHEAAGEAGWADHYRTKLERESALTAAEAAKVTLVAFQWRQDDMARIARNHELFQQLKAANPNARLSAVLSPEQRHQEAKDELDLLDAAIAHLVLDLGSRSFSRLDLYTRYMPGHPKDPQQSTDASSVPGNGEKQSGSTSATISSYSRL